jgi:hypothetical protein
MKPNPTGSRYAYANGIWHSASWNSAKPNAMAFGQMARCQIRFEGILIKSDLTAFDKMALYKIPAETTAFYSRTIHLGLFFCISIVLI